VSLFIIWGKHWQAHFAGIVLETPFGPLALDERHYRGGREAAAAICHQVDAAGGQLHVPAP